MSDRENAEIFKEQLRSRNLELKKMSAEKGRFEGRIKNILKINKKANDELQDKLDTAIKTLRAHSLKEEEERKAEKKRPQKGEPEDSDSSATRPRSGPITFDHLDPKLKADIIKLKNHNRDLEAKIKDAAGEKNRLAEERKLLFQEIKKLKDQPGVVQALKAKFKQKDEEVIRTIKSYQEILEEKENIIASFETIFSDNLIAKDDGKEPNEILQKIRAEIQSLRGDKNRLQNDLKNQRQVYNSQIADEVVRLESEFKAKMKKLRILKNNNRIPDDFLESEPGAPLWMVTFADMTTLLLTFFILYYSISSMNEKRFKEAILGEKSASIGLLKLLDAAEIKQTIAQMSGLRSGNIMQELNEAVRSSPAARDVELATHNSKIIMRLPVETLFKSGEAQLQLSARPALDQVIEAIRSHPDYKVNIQGHTDNEPILNGKFPTNWELSASRATAVLRYFVEKNVKPERLTATGYADIFPLVSNETARGRSRNRRVEIVLEK